MQRDCLDVKFHFIFARCCLFVVVIMAAQEDASHFASCFTIIVDLNPNVFSSRRKFLGEKKPNRNDHLFCFFHCRCAIHCPSICLAETVTREVTIFSFDSIVGVLFPPEIFFYHLDSWDRWEGCWRDVASFLEFFFSGIQCLSQVKDINVDSKHATQSSSSSRRSRRSRQNLSISRKQILFQIYFIVDVLLSRPTFAYFFCKMNDGRASLVLTF